MEQHTISSTAEQQESASIAGHNPPITMTGQKTKTTVPDRRQDTVSTVSSDSGKPSQSSERRKVTGYAAHETDPTSRASEVLDNIDQKPPTSVEADRGSDVVRSDASSSSGSDNSRRALAEPTTTDRVEAIGSHLANDNPGPTVPVELDYDPRDADEARAASTRIGCVYDVILAFENNDPLPSSRDDQPYQLSVQAAPHTDIEQQQEVERTRDEIRAHTKIIVIVVIFVALGLVLYGQILKK